MTSLIFATNNPNKVTEIQSLLIDQFHIISLAEAGIYKDIPEPYFTLEENAREKSNTIYQLTKQNCFAEDTGLEVAALNGAPGVLSARYAGEQKSASDNIKKLLINLKGNANRQARFRTVVSLIINGKEYQFEGTCNGRIAIAPEGKEGFGYDPVFIPDGAGKTFACMILPEKNKYSHRAKAVKKLIQFLNEFNR